MKKLKSTLVSLMFLSILMLSLGISPVRGQPTNLNILNVDSIGEPMDIDPAWSYDTASAELLMNVYETLLWFNRTETNEYLPILATEWHFVLGAGKLSDGTILTTSPEGYTWGGRWEFKIRLTAEGGFGIPRFHDAGGGHSWEGAAVTTADVEYTFERLLVTDCATGPAWMVWDAVFLASWAGDLNDTLTERGYPINPTTHWNTKVDEAIDHAVESNSTWVWFNLPAAYPPFLQIVAQQWGSIMSKAWCTDTSISGHQYEWPGMKVGDNDDWADYHDPAKSPIYYVSTHSPGKHLDAMLGTGPYVFDYWNTGAGGCWHIVKNNNYWRGWTDYDGLHPAHVTEGYLNYIPEWATRRLRFLGGISDFTVVPRMYMSEVLGKPGIDCMWPLPQLVCDGIFFTELVAKTSTFMGQGPLVNATLDTGWSSLNAPQNMFNFTDVRLAFAHAFNYTSFLEAALLNEAISPTTPILDILAPNVAQPGQAENPALGLKKQYGIDGELAGQLAFDFDLAVTYLKKVPGLWANGLTMTFAYNEGNLIRELGARIMKAGFDWISANVAGAPTFNIKIVMVPWNGYKILWSTRVIPLYIVGWLADYPDAHNFAHPFMHSAGAFSKFQGFKGVTEFPNQWVDDEIALGISDVANRAVHYDLLNHYFVDNAPSLALDVATGRHFQRDWVDTGKEGGTGLWTKTHEGRWVYNPIYPGEYGYDTYKSLAGIEIKYLDVEIESIVLNTPTDPVWLADFAETVCWFNFTITLTRLDTTGPFEDFVVGLEREDTVTGYIIVVDFTTINLGPLDSDTVILSGKYNDLGPGAYTHKWNAIVLPTHSYVADTNLANNILGDGTWPVTVYRFADIAVPLDGWCRAPDLNVFGHTWYTSVAVPYYAPLDTTWNPLCDFDGNTQIRTPDLNILGRCWSLQCPPAPP